MNIVPARLRKLITQKQIVRAVAMKNLKDKYVGSSLGISWAIINPLLVTLAVSFVFTQVVKSGMKNFPLLVMSGLLPLYFFVNSLNESAGSIRQHLDILRRFVMSKEIIPISVILANLVNFLIGFLIMLPIFAVCNPAIMRYSFLLPAVTLLYVMFIFGIALLFSVLGVYSRDLPQLLSIVTMFLFWMTPVFYTLEQVPVELRWIILVNPLSSYVTLYQALLYQGSAGAAQVWLLAAGLSFVSGVGGYVFFVRNEDRILKYI